MIMKRKKNQQLCYWFTYYLTYFILEYTPSYKYNYHETMSYHVSRSIMAHILSLQSIWVVSKSHIKWLTYTIYVCISIFNDIHSIMRLFNISQNISPLLSNAWIQLGLYEVMSIKTPGGINILLSKGRKTWEAINTTLGRQLAAGRPRFWTFQSVRNKCIFFTIYSVVFCYSSLRNTALRAYLKNTLICWLYIKVFVDDDAQDVLYLLCSAMAKKIGEDENQDGEELLIIEADSFVLSTSMYVWNLS